MAWIKRKADEHVCQFPVRVNKLAPSENKYTTSKSNIPDATNGDIWECNSLNCSKRYEVTITTDQRDGDFITFSLMETNYVLP